MISAAGFVLLRAGLFVCREDTGCPHRGPLPLPATLLTLYFIDCTAVDSAGRSFRPGVY